MPFTMEYTNKSKFLGYYDLFKRVQIQPWKLNTRWKVSYLWEKTKESLFKNIAIGLRALMRCHDRYGDVWEVVGRLVFHWWNNRTASIPLHSQYPLTFKETIQILLQNIDLWLGLISVVHRLFPSALLIPVIGYCFRFRLGVASGSSSIWTTGKLYRVLHDYTPQYNHRETIDQSGDTILFLSVSLRSVISHYTSLFHHQAQFLFNWATFHSI